MTNNKVKKTALDRKLDKIRAAEESGKLGTKLTNRTLRKLTSNKLAVIGILLFVVCAVLSLIIYNVIPSTTNEEDFQ